MTRLLAPKTWGLGSNPLSHPLALSPTKNHLYVGGGGGRLETLSHYYGWLPHGACKQKIRNSAKLQSTKLPVAYNIICSIKKLNYKNKPRT